MLKINLYMNKDNTSRFFGKIYGRVENSKPIDIDGLAEHMAEHNTPYSKGVIKGILTDMAGCIKELMLMGQPVKLADLAIFKASAVSKPANSVEDFNLNEHIDKVRLCAEATGELTRKELTADALLGYTSLAQRIKNGEAVLSTEKKKYLVGEDDNNGGGSNPVVTP